MYGEVLHQSGIQHVKQQLTYSSKPSWNRESRLFSKIITEQNKYLE